MRSPLPVSLLIAFEVSALAIGGLRVLSLQVAQQPVKRLPVVVVTLPPAEVADVLGRHVRLPVVLLAREDVVVEADREQDFGIFTPPN